MTVEKTLADIIAINSVFPKEEALEVFINKYLRSIGFKTQTSKVQEGRPNLYAERGTVGKPILFYGHLDTVPLYGNWNTDPFKLTRVGERLYGLGACDMKGGVAAILESVSQETDRKIKLLFCVDEENISRGAWHFVHGHKSWFKDTDLLISADPGVSDKTLGGTGVITAGRRGRTVISINIKGISSHGSEPERGISAINEAANIIRNIKHFKFRNHPNLGRESLFVREVHSSATSLSVPDKASLDFDIQLVPPSTVKDAKERVQELIHLLYKKYILNPKTKVSTEVKTRDTPYMEPFATDLKNKAVRKVFNIVERASDKPIVNYGSSVADDNVFSNVLKIPVLSLAPQGGNEHTANEWVSSKSLEQLTALYKLLIQEF